jgi:hypothetical protein
VHRQLHKDSKHLRKARSTTFGAFGMPREAEPSLNERTFVLKRYERRSGSMAALSTPSATWNFLWRRVRNRRCTIRQDEVLSGSNHQTSTTIKTDHLSTLQSHSPHLRLRDRTLPRPQIRRHLHHNHRPLPMASPLSKSAGKPTLPALPRPRLPSSDKTKRPSQTTPKPSSRDSSKSHPPLLRARHRIPLPNRRPQMLVRPRRRAHPLHDGGLLDASCIAIIAALQHFRRPDVSIAGRR